MGSCSGGWTTSCNILLQKAKKKKKDFFQYPPTTIFANSTSNSQNISKIPTCVLQNSPAHDRNPVIFFVFNPIPTEKKKEMKKNKRKKKQREKNNKKKMKQKARRDMGIKTAGKCLFIHILCWGGCNGVYPYFAVSTGSTVCRDPPLTGCRESVIQQGNRGGAGMFGALQPRGRRRVAIFLTWRKMRRWGPGDFVG